MPPGAGLHRKGHLLWRLARDGRLGGGVAELGIQVVGMDIVYGVGVAIVDGRELIVAHVPGAAVAVPVPFLYHLDAADALGVVVLGGVELQHGRVQVL